MKPTNLKAMRMVTVVLAVVVECVQAGTLRVDPNDPNAYTTIQAAVDAAIDGDVVLVADGIYQPSPDLWGSMIHVYNSIVIRSEGGPQHCVIQSRQHCRAVYIGDTTLEATIEGFTIKQATSGEGGAIYSTCAGKLTVSHCIFENNSAYDGDGGAVFLKRGTTHFYACTFENNSASDDGGAIACNEGATLLLEDSVFISNSSQDNGGALFCRNTQISLRRSSFYGNRADSNGGAGYIRDSHSHFLNCLFSGNHAADDGGVLYVRQARATMVHCTLAGNRADGQGGGLASNNTRTIYVYDSILWNNEDSDGRGADAQLTETDTIVAYSCIQHWPQQESILTQDPLFMDADGADDTVGTDDDDLHLQGNSPCIDTGLFTSVSWPLELDLERQTRLVGTAVDMGALEYGSRPAETTMYTFEITEPVMVSEVYTHSPDSNDWIEVHNTTDQSVNIGGWILTDGYYLPYDPIDSLFNQDYVFEPNTILSPGEYLILTEGQELPFALNAGGEQLSFLSGMDGVPTGYIEMHAFDYARSRVSLIRHVNSQGLLEFVPSVEPTPGSINTDPAVGPIVISEINYDRDEEPYQYIELLNIGPNSVTVFHNGGQSYAIQGSARFNYQEVNDVVLEPNQRVVIANYPDILRNGGLPKGVQVVGPLIGELPRQGGIVSLVYPGGQAIVDKVIYNVGIGLYDDEWKYFWLGGANSDHNRSLERIDPHAYGNDPANWQLVLPTMGY